MSTDIIKQIKDGLAPMFERARKEKLWFRSFYQNMWFSPDELQAKHDEGELLWGAVNWELVDPNKKIKYLENEIEEKKKEIEYFKERIKNEQKTKTI